LRPANFPLYYWDCVLGLVLTSLLLGLTIGSIIAARLV
jgi:hypothetical protein